MKKIQSVLCFILAFSVIAPLSMYANVDDLATSSSANRCVEETVNLLLSSDDQTYYTVDSQILLMSFVNDLPLYTLYRFSPSGYAVFLNETMSFLEGSLEDNEIVDGISENSICYYGGPCNYYIRNGIKFVSLETGNVLSTQDKAEIAVIESNVHQIERNNAANRSYCLSDEDIVDRGIISPLIEYSVAPNYFSNLTDFGNNTLGTCTVISECILLGYYDVYVDDDYVDSIYRSGNGTNDAFHLYMNGLIYGSGTPGAIYIHNTCSAVNNYLSNQGLSTHLYSTYSSQHAAIYEAETRLSLGHPVIMSMSTTHSALWNHTCVVYGLIYEDGTIPDSTGVFRCHMGWKNATAGYTLTQLRSLSLACSWFYECGYIN